ncbi:MAG: hypothetical protein ACRCTQ_06905 [Brevinemataceae bacterium]
MKILIILFLFLSYCGKNNNNDNNVDFSSSENSNSVISNNTLFTNSNDIMKLIDFNTNETFVLDSPKKFLQISILFMTKQYENYRYIKQSSKESNDQYIDQYLNESRDAFFHSLGITEDEYVQYGVNNNLQIQEFLDHNPDFAYIYELSISKITD